MVVVRAKSAPRGRACYLGRADEHNSGLVKRDKRDKKLSGQSHVIKGEIKEKGEEKYVQKDGKGKNARKKDGKKEREVTSATKGQGRA